MSAADQPGSEVGPKFEVLPPLEYSTQPTAPRRGKIQPTGKTAVLVVHGMGQPVPFQTLDQVVEGLRLQEENRTRNPNPIPKVGIRSVKLGNEDLKRIEVDLTRLDGRKQEVHIYEAYWAPFTEGEVGIGDVLKFLVGGGFNGFGNGNAGFSRWMFGRMVDFGKKPGTTITLFLALLVMASLILMNAIVAMVAASRANDAGWPGPELLSGLTTYISLFLAVATMLWISLWFAGKAKRWLRPRLGSPYTSVSTVLLKLLYWTLVTVSWVFFVLTLVAAIATFYGIIFLLVLDRLHATDWVSRVAVVSWPVWSSAALWGVLLVLTWKARSLLVEYVGDVAAYISSHKLDRFFDLRQRIKTCVRTTARNIYTARRRRGRGFEYDGVVLVGHSLGSVIAYETLNELIAQDLYAPKPARADATRRTWLLLTFGSPLDKTAFVFGAQRKSTTETREALAGLKQPLIQDYRHREFYWVNLYAPADILSNRLDFYDEPLVSARARRGKVETAWDPVEEMMIEHPRRVINLKDPYATIPLMAHTEYWNNPSVWEILHAHVTS